MGRVVVEGARAAVELDVGVALQWVGGARVELGAAVRVLHLVSAALVRATGARCTRARGNRINYANCL